MLQLTRIGRRLSVACGRSPSPADLPLPGRAKFPAPRLLLRPREAARRRPPPMEVSAETGFPRDEADPRKRLAPAAGRNKQPILEVLQAHLPAAVAGTGSLDVLEVASGTGEHCAHFASNLPVTSWQPTEYTGCASPLMTEQEINDIFESIVAFTESLPNVKPPLPLDAGEAVWTTIGEPGVTFDALVAVNVTHISPVSVTEGIVAAASRLLNSDGSGRLVFYGPFAERGQELSEGNAKFEAMLQSRACAWPMHTPMMHCSVATLE